MSHFGLTDLSSLLGHLLAVFAIVSGFRAAFIQVPSTTLLSLSLIFGSDYFLIHAENCKLGFPQNVILVSTSRLLPL